MQLSMTEDKGQRTKDRGQATEDDLICRLRKVGVTGRLGLRTAGHAESTGLLSLDSALSAVTQEASTPTSYTYHSPTKINLLLCPMHHAS